MNGLVYIQVVYKATKITNTFGRNDSLFNKVLVCSKKKPLRNSETAFHMLFI